MEHQFTGFQERLVWLFDENRGQYICDLSPLVVAVVYKGRNRDQKLKWFGRLVGAKIIDLYAEFETHIDAQFFTTGTLETILIEIREMLKENSKELS